MKIQLNNNASIVLALMSLFATACVFILAIVYPQILEKQIELELAKQGIEYVDSKKD